MPPTAPSVEGTFRALRTVHFVLLASILLYIWAGEKVIRHNQQVPGRAFSTAFGLFAAATSVAALVVRTKTIQPALDLLQTQPNDTSALNRWRSGSILSYVLAESVVLFGFSLRIFGGTLALSAPFYIAAIVLMIFLRPQRP
ncbi:MAG: hypothetical protein WCD49_10545 [Candidatus Acidiferrales bacterium]